VFRGLCPGSICALSIKIQINTSHSKPTPVTVAEWSKARTVLAHLDAGIVCSNPTRGMDVHVYVYVYSMFVLPCVGSSLVQGVLPTVLD
jgi:hypothetical protein